MGVSTKTMLQKMTDELEKAKNTSHQKESMLIHISHIKLLCDVLLEEYEQVGLSNEDEDVSTQKVVHSLNEQKSKQIGEGHEGTSIFDF